MADGTGLSRAAWPSARCRAMVVEVHQILAQHLFEVANEPTRSTPRGQKTAVDDQHSIEQFAACGADPSFGDRVRPGCSHRGAQDADALTGEHGIEGVGEFAVSISDQERELGRAITEVHHEVARLLRNPAPFGFAVMSRRWTRRVARSTTNSTYNLWNSSVSTQKKSVARMPWA